MPEKRPEGLIDIPPSVSGGKLCQVIGLWTFCDDGTARVVPGLSLAMMFARGSGRQ